MTLHGRSEKCQLEALKRLAQLTSAGGMVKIVKRENTFINFEFMSNSDQEVTDACKARVLKTMKEFPSSVDIQINCCTVLCNIALSGIKRVPVGIGSSSIEYMFGNGRHVVYFFCALYAASEDDVLFSKDYINPICLAMRVGLLDYLCMHVCAKSSI